MDKKEMRKDEGEVFILFKRKIYASMLAWKQEFDGRAALLVEGARRIGKSTVVEEFAKNEYESYIMIDFSVAPKAITELFDDILDLNYVFLQLQLHYNTNLTERKSLIFMKIWLLKYCPLKETACFTTHF